MIGKVSAAGCPVTAATLDKVLPHDMRAAGYRLTPTTVRCWKGWAYGRDNTVHGDGNDLFWYGHSTGWHYYGEGSAFACKDLGLTIDRHDPPPFCG